MSSQSFTATEQAAIRRAFEHVLKNASWKEVAEILGTEPTFIGAKLGIGLTPDVRPNKYVLRLSPKETVALGLVMLAAAPLVPELIHELKDVRDSVEAQAEARIHDQEERETAEGRAQFTSAS